MEWVTFFLIFKDNQICVEEKKHKKSLEKFGTSREDNLYLALIANQAAFAFVSRPNETIGAGA